MPSLIASLGIASYATAQAGDNPAAPPQSFWGHGMMWGGAPWGGIGMVLGTVVTLLALAAIVAATVYALRRMVDQGPRPPGDPPEDQAMAHLKDRYARGEIDTAEFEERRKRLSD